MKPCNWPKSATTNHYTRLIAHNLGLPRSIARRFWRGLALAAPDAARRAQALPPMPQEATAHLNMARCYLYRGDIESCEKHLEAALECCQLFNLVVSLARKPSRLTAISIASAMTLKRAAEFYERAARAYDEAGIDLVRCELLDEQAVLNLQFGDSAGGALTA